MKLFVVVRNNNINKAKIWDKLFISLLETECGRKMKCILVYKQLNPDLWTRPWISVGFECKFLLLPVYVLWSIHVDLKFDPKVPDEPNEAFLISISIISIF